MTAYLSPPEISLRVGASALNIAFAKAHSVSPVRVGPEELLFRPAYLARKVMPPAKPYPTSTPVGKVRCRVVPSFFVVNASSAKAGTA